LIAAFCRMLGEQLIDGKAALVSGESLSRRQRQTLELLLSGNAEKQIAAHLSISRHTVHVYVKSLYKRFGVSSRGELLARWVQK
jgi:DNA-binding CsgD family transcriptional regulator